MADTDQIVTGNTPLTQPENRVFYPALDGMRALAFLIVFARHYLYIPWGFAGVDLFFVLSGFLITGILFDTRDDPHRVRTFYIRRTLRIFPLYLGLFLVLFLLTPLMHWVWTPAWLAWPLYVGNFLSFHAAAPTGTPWERIIDAQLGNPQPLIYLGHLWSLCVEEQFYLVWPWVVFFVRRRRTLLWICIVAVVLVPLARVHLQHHAADHLFNTEVVLYRVTPFRIDALLLGALLALLYRGPYRDSMLRFARWLFWIATAFIVPALGYALCAMPSYNTPPWQFTWGLVLIDFYGAAMLLVALQPGTLIYRAFTVAPLRWLGRISYGAYLFHDVIHVVVYRVVLALFGPSIEPTRYMEMSAAAAFIVTIPLAWLSYRFYETPFLNLKRWTVQKAGDISLAAKL